MLELPRDGQSKADARKEMLEEINNELTIVLITRDAKDQAFLDRVEKVLRGRRRAIVLRDPDILTKGEEEQWFSDDKAENGDQQPVIAAVLNNSRGRCGCVWRSRAQSTFIDKAFLACEKQKGKG